MSSNYLNLNKKNVRKSVVDKLNTLGYKVTEDTPIWQIRNIIMKIQKDNGLMIDGCVGVRTMAVLGYSWEETKNMLKIRRYRSESFYGYPIWLLWS